MVITVFDHGMTKRHNVKTRVSYINTFWISLENIDATCQTEGLYERRIQASDINFDPNFQEILKLIVQ